MQKKVNSRTRDQKKIMNRKQKTKNMEQRKEKKKDRALSYPPKRSEKGEPSPQRWKTTAEGLPAHGPCIR